MRAFAFAILFLASSVFAQTTTVTTSSTTSSTVLLPLCSQMTVTVAVGGSAPTALSCISSATYVSTSSTSTSSSSSSSTSTSSSSTSTSAAATTSTSLVVGSWANRMGGTGADNWNAVATDSSGNVYLTGPFSGTITESTGSLTSAGNQDWIVEKKNSAGVTQWAVKFGGVNNDTPFGIAVRGSTLAVVGNIGDNASDGQIVVFEASTGVQRWARTFGSTSSDAAQAVAVDTAENVVVTGYFRGTVSFGTATPLKVPFDTDLDLFIAKYSSTGTPQFAEHFCNTGNDRGYSIVTDSANNIILTGYFTNSVDFAGINTGTLPPSCYPGDGTNSFTTIGASLDGFLLKLSPTGAFTWVKRQGSTTGNNEQGYAVALDSSDAVYATGTATSALDVGGGLRAKIGSPDVWLAKWSSAGTFSWDKHIGGTVSTYGKWLALDSSNNVILVGGFAGQTGFGGGSATAAPSATSSASDDAYVALYTNSGTPISVTTGGGSGSDYAQGVAVTTSSRPVVVGYFAGTTATFVGNLLTNAGSIDGFAFAYQP